MFDFVRNLTRWATAIVIAWLASANLTPILAQNEPPPRPPRGPDAREGRPPEDIGPSGPRDEGRPLRPRRGPDEGGPGGPGQGGPGERGGPPRPGEGFESERVRDPEMFKLDKADMELARHCMELSDRYQNATTEEKAKLKTEIEQAVTKNFEVRQQRRALELKRLEQELNRLRQSIERREKDKQRLIQQRTSDLTDGEGDKRF